MFERIVTSNNDSSRSTSLDFELVRKCGKDTRGIELAPIFGTRLLHLVGSLATLRRSQADRYSERSVAVEERLTCEQQAPRSTSNAKIASVAAHLEMHEQPGSKGPPICRDQRHLGILRKGASNAARRCSHLLATVGRFPQGEPCHSRHVTHLAATVGSD